jgi:hypothetical protein
VAAGCPALVQAQPCTQTLPTGNLTGVLNTYYPGVGTATAGGTTITVDLTAIRGASTTMDIVAGDMLLVVQMQDAQYNQVNTVDFGDGAGGLVGAGWTALQNTGRYEYVVAQSVAAGVITIRGGNIQPGPVYGLLNTYTTAAADDSGGTRNGQRTFQVVRVSRRASGTLTAGLTASAWNGRTGGVLAVDVTGDLALGGVTVSVDGLGFRGGVGASIDGSGTTTDTDYMSVDSLASQGRKGEGIACTPTALGGVPGASGNDGCPRGDKSRGAPGNAGGGGTDGNPGTNDENTGGGGGGNGGAGGQGGTAWNSAETVGGKGGPAFPAGAGLLVMGGGGGAGTSNNAGPADGAAGGGMVFIRTGSVSGTGTISANGAAARCSGQDGAGGGGAGGSILFFNQSGALTNLTVNAAGGRGGDGDFGTFGATNCAISNSPHGPGGGGGGGVIFTSSAVNAASSVVGAPSGRTTGNIAYGSVAGSNGTLTTTLAVTSIPGVQACTLATNASVAGLRVRPGLVEFATASQRDTLAFTLYETADPVGRKGLRPLVTKPVAAPLPDTLDAVLYRVPVKRLVGPYLLIEETEINGRRHKLGPFPLDDAELVQAFERLEARATREQTRTVRGATLLTGRPLHRASAARTEGPSVEAPAGGVPPLGVKIETRGAGYAAVELADLYAAGLAPGRPEDLRVFNLGHPVPMRLVRRSGPPSLVFTAEPLGTDYTDRNAYVVQYGDAPPSKPAVAFTRSGPAVPQGFRRIQTNAFYAPFLAQESDPWVWDFLVSGLPTVTETFALGRLAPGPQMASVRVLLSGSSSHRHSVEVALNGVPVGKAIFVGRTPATVTGNIPRALLRETGNELALDYTVLDPTEDSGVAFLDAIDVDALPSPVANERPIADVVRVAPFEPRLPDLSTTDYLVVTHGDFTAAADRLAALRGASGRRTAVVDVERAYDAYAGGVREAGAVHELLVSLAPGSMVVLFGDDTLDPRDYLGLGSRTFVPSLMGWDGQFGRVASENRYADLDGDGRPELAIGRLPASTAAEADTLVDKIVAGAPVLGPRSTQLVAVDDHGPSDASFVDIAGRVTAPTYLGAPRWANVADGIGTARATLFDAWSHGPVVVQYFGHAGPETWADEHLLTPADASALANIGPAPVLFTWTCQAQWYQYHLGPSVNEALVQAPAGGALAALGPTGISDPGLQAQFAERVLAFVGKGLPLGTAVRKAKAGVLGIDPEMRGVVEGFTLLGDPALAVGGDEDATARDEQP